MSNFFKELVLCEKTILNADRLVVEEEVVDIFNDFLRCIQSGICCSKSKSDMFICKYYNQNYSSMVKLWRAEGNGDKSSNTFRCQVHNLSMKLYKVFGTSIFDLFYSQSLKELREIEVKIQALSFKDVSFEDIFYREISEACSYRWKTPRQNYKMEDCVSELNLLGKIKRSRFESALALKDADRLEYIRRVLNQPLIDASGVSVNMEKMNILKALDVM